MVKTLNFEPYFANALPETYALIMSANLIVHPTVERITLHGSRGLAGGYRSDSDIDLSLIVDTPQTADMEEQLREVLETTLNHWLADVELDLAVVFDIMPPVTHLPWSAVPGQVCDREGYSRNCKLACFEQMRWDEQFCRVGGVDCFGLYKTQKGFNGLVTHAGIQVKLMYPCLKIWRRR